ncbi:voltage-dependent anion channel protein [Perkinsela sp. CCAP 1560/4]|nr:voltage-dependent anion channel protein [Perkinsela sp. CCAP 1560/4]|eukprot:KNH05318.1 voltage-dependent anion channel protein [Perkinsela sp. CCAP 1560/4]
MAVFFKDFERDIDSFFKKNYIGANKGQFRLESIRKPVDGQIYLNNLFEGNTFSLNMHYDSRFHGLSSKLSLFSNGSVGSSIAWKYVLGAFQNAIEFREQFDMHNIAGFKAELSHRSAADVVAIESRHTFSPKAVAKSEVGISCAVPNIAGLSVGCGMNFDSAAASNMSPMKYGAVYKAFSKSLVAVTADQKGDYSVGIRASLRDLVSNAYDACGILQVINRSNKVAVNLGASTACPFSGSTLCAKTDLKGKYGISVSRALNDVARFSVGFEGDVRAGLKLPTESFTFSVVTE